MESEHGSEQGRDEGRGAPERDNSLCHSLTLISLSRTLARLPLSFPPQTPLSLLSPLFSPPHASGSATLLALPLSSLLLLQLILPLAYHLLPSALCVCVLLFYVSSGPSLFSL